MTPYKSRGRGRGSARPHGPKREHVSELHPVETPPDIATFAEWELGPDIQRAIAAMDIVKPTPIQALAIGPVLSGRDVIAKAQTGTGKTLAFGAPMMAKIDAARATVLGLVMCPTRELAQQVHGVLSTLGFPRGVRVAMCVGGDPIHPQIAELQAGAQVVVGTPGRILDLYQQRFLSFPWTEFVVLDEADKMFEIGFIDDIKKILSFTPEERQTLLFSATFPTEVLKLARESTRDPLEVATAAGTVTVDTVEQCFIQIGDEDRPMALVRLLEQSGPKDVFLVFCARRTDVDRLMRSLERANLAIKALHGGYDQASRFRVMSAFRTGEVKALIATDVASRGLDVEHVTHVINFSVPRDAEDYTHRIGRTGRAGRTGTAITFVTPRERRDWQDILARTKAKATELEPPGRTGARRERTRGDSGRDPSGEPRRERDAHRDERPPERDEPRHAARSPAHDEARDERRSERKDERSGERRARAEVRPARDERRHEARRAADQGRAARRDERHPMHETHARRQASEPETPQRSERPARNDRPTRDERPAREERSRNDGARSRSEQRGRHERPAHGDARSAQQTSRPGSTGAGRPARGERERSTPRVEGMPIQDRSPEESQRRRRRGRGRAGRPEFDRRDPDGLGRWANRADDFD